MFEIVVSSGEWVVLHAGLEVARYDAEASAMRAVAERMREQPSDEPVAFSIRFSSARPHGVQTRISK